MMAMAAARPCCHPGCRQLVRGEGSRCEVHRSAMRREQDARRGSAHDRLYTATWRKARAGFLRAHPLCAEHERQGELVAASVVDHIVPHRGDYARFWQRENWQPLCKACHDRKTAREDGGFGRAPPQVGSEEGAG